MGKTTFARNIISKIKNKVYLDLENRDDFHALQNPALFFQAHRRAWVVIDEEQRIPELFPVLRSEIDACRKPGRFLLLGSASPDLLKKVPKHSPEGWYSENYPPLLVSEVYPDINYEKHCLRGGYPEVLYAKHRAFPFLR